MQHQLFCHCAHLGYFTKIDFSVISTRASSKLSEVDLTCLDLHWHKLTMWSDGLQKRIDDYLSFINHPYDFADPAWHLYSTHLLFHGKDKTFSMPIIKVKRLIEILLWESSQQFIRESCSADDGAWDRGNKKPSPLNLSSPVLSDLCQLLNQELVLRGKSLTGNHEIQFIFSWLSNCILNTFTYK